MKTVILDFDGIFTTAFIVDENNYRFKTLNPNIKSAIDALRTVARVVILSSSKSPKSLAITKSVADKHGFADEDVFVAVSDKIKLLQHNGLWNSNTTYIGDDYNDFKMKALADVLPNSPDVIIPDTDKQVNALRDLALSLVPAKAETDLDVIVSQTMGSNILVVQQYSMRSYETGKYAVMTDGNFAVIRRQIDMSYPGIKWTITIPVLSQIADKKELAKWLAIHPNVEVMPFTYGENAAANREVVFNIKKSGFTGCISYFPVNTKFESSAPTVMFMMNVSYSKHNKHVKRNYKEINFIKQSCHVSDFTCYLNDEQLESMSKISKFVKATGIVPNSKVLFHELEACDHDIQRKLNQFFDGSKLALYFPYRLSDSDYDVKGLANANPDKLIIVTDPNNSLTTGEDRLKNVLPIHNIVGKDISSKSAHQQMLRAIVYGKCKIKAVLAGNVDQVFHSTPVEMATLLSAKDTVNHAGFERRMAKQFVKGTKT